MKSLSDSIAAVVASIPPGRVLTYGQVAATAGNPKGARLVVWTLNARSEKDSLPWWRVVGKHPSRKGFARVSLPGGPGRDLQVSLLSGEGIIVDDDGSIDLSAQAGLS